MSIINKMHKDFQQVQGEAPILAPMPAKNKTKKIIIMVLSALLLSSSLGLSYLIFLKTNQFSSEGLLTTEGLSNLNGKTTKKNQQVAKLNESSLTSSSAAKTTLSLKSPVKSAVIQGSINNPSSEPTSNHIVVDGLILKETVTEKPVVDIKISTVEAMPISENISVGAATASPTLVTQKTIPQHSIQQQSIQQPIQKQSSQKQSEQQQPIQKTQIVELLASDKNSPVKATTTDSAKQANVTKQVNVTKQGSHLKITPVQLSDPELASIYLKEAKKAKQKGDNDLAAQKWQKALALQPRLNEVRQSLAMYYYAQGEVNKSINLLKKGVIASPGFSDFNLMLSRIAAKEGDLQKAFLYLDSNPPVVQGNLDYHVSYAILAQKFEYFEKSEKLYSDLLVNRPKDGRWRMSLAIAQDKQSKTKQAVSNYQKALLETSLSSNAKAYINQRLSYLAANSGIL